MIRNGKIVCDWCGQGFRTERPVSYSDGTHYHQRCLSKVGGKTDLGRTCVVTQSGKVECGQPVPNAMQQALREQVANSEEGRLITKLMQKAAAKNPIFPKKLPTTGPYSTKKYKCTRCGLVQEHGTNHWGEIYPTCRGCSWKNPMAPQATMVCMEKMPAGYAKPQPWKHVRLGDVAKIEKIKIRRRTL